MSLRQEFGDADYDLMRKAWTTGDPADSWPGEGEDEPVPMTPLQERAALLLAREA